MSESYEYNDSSLSNKMNDESVNAYIKKMLLNMQKNTKEKLQKEFLVLNLMHLIGF